MTTNKNNSSKPNSLRLNIGQRPICKFCNTRERVLGNKRKDGTYNFQSMCNPCKLSHLKNKNGRSYTEQIAFNFGFSSVEEYNADKKIRQQIAKDAGFLSIVEYEMHCAEQEAMAAGFENARDYKNHKIALNAGFSNYNEYRNNANHEIALKSGFSNYVDFMNSKHPYSHRKDYCENIDGRLGFTCTSTILMLAQLDADHIDGNPENHNPENIQTLCKCCHSYKTITEKDYLTPGRKALGIKY